MNVRPGEPALAFYKARSLADGAITGTATFNVTPTKAGAYFAKTECFCFTEQTLAIGFHGAHVIIGKFYLAVCLWHVWRGNFKPDHHFGFEAAAWYWQFVDVVWIFLFTFIYWWEQ